jgi:hypothetical protein
VPRADEFPSGRDRGSHNDGDAYLDDEQGTDASAQLAVIQRHQVTLACLAVIVASVIWKAAFLGHYYFRQDDLHGFDVALRSGLNWSYLTHVQAGHLFPGVNLIAWVLARAALYNWAAGSAVVVVMIAAASLAAWRVLRTLLGNRPAVLIPLTLYVLSPLVFPTDSWWITAVEAIPLQIALFMALNSHVHYARTGNFRHAAVAAGWIAFGLLFFEKSVFIPLVLFAVTAGFLTSRKRLLPAARATAVRLWKGWLLYVALVAAYGAIFLTALPTSGNQPAIPGSFQSVYTFASKLVLDTLLPGLLGGPWHWFHTGTSAGAYSLPPPGLDLLSLVVVLAVVVVSILIRRRAWRAWVMLAGWVVLADMVPIIIGRVSYAGYAAIFGMETRYVADATAVFPIVLALAFWPVAEPEGDRADTAAPRSDFFYPRQWRSAAIAMVAVIVIGSIWSVQRFESLTAGGALAIGAYFTNARAALAEVPAGTVIVSQQVPSSVMIGAFGQNADTSVVLKPLSHRGSQISWTAQPVGAIDQLRVFGPDGRLWPAAIAGSTTVRVPSRFSCMTVKRSRLVLNFPVSSQTAGALAYAHVLRIGYLGGAGIAGQTVTVSDGSFVGQFAIRPGLHKVYFAIRGGAPDVVLQTQAHSGGLCFAPAVAGNVVPFPGGPIPSIAS